MSSEIGTLVARITADTTDLERGLSKAQSKLEDIGAIGAKAGLGLATALAAAAAAVAALAEHGIALADELKETADKIGITADQLAGLRYSAQLAGVESTALEQAIKKLAKGGSEAADALKYLGISQEELRKLPLTEQLLKVGDALNSVQNETSRLALSQAILGKSGAELSGMFRQGTDAIREQINAAQELGLTLDKNQIEATQKAADAQDTLKASVNGLSMQLGAALSPAFTAAANAATDLVKIVTAAIPKLQSLDERILGVQFAAASLGDDTLRTRLVDTFREIDAVNNAIADFERTGDPQVKSGGNGSYNALLEQRTALLARQNELLAESVKRKREAETADANPNASHDTRSPFDPEQAKKDAAAELALVTAVYAEQDRLAALEQAQEATYRQSTFEAQESFYGEELKQLQTWGEVLAAEQDKQNADALDRLIQHQGLFTQAQQKGEQQRKQFTQMTTGAQVGFVLDSLEQITAAGAQHNKEMFRINKLAGIANAIIHTAEGVTAALKIPPPAGFILAGAVAAAGAVQIQAIRKTTFEGGGSGTTPSAAASMPSVNGTPVQGNSEPHQIITVRGLNPDQLFSGRQVVALLNGALKDGAKLVLQP